MTDLAPKKPVHVRIAVKWQEAWCAPFALEGFLSIGVLAAVLTFMAHFLDRVELRPGFMFDDPVLSLFQAGDMTWVTFGLIYCALAGTAWALLHEPKRLWFTLQAYSLLLIFRAIAMSMLPLDPPIGMIVLQDPVVEYFGNAASPLTKDLFFSGHTSTMFLLALVMPDRRVKPLMYAATLLVGACVLYQKVHYTVDVVAAPFFAYGAFRMMGGIREKVGLD